MFVFYFLLLASAYSFLLDNPQGNGGTTITNQYLTLSKFYEEMKLQQEDTANVHRETIKLRHDTDNCLTLLTTQLQQKFDLLDKKLAEIERQNDSNSDFVNLEQKYIQLEQKYLNLEQIYITQGNELAMLKNKSHLLEKNIENLQHLGSTKPLQEVTILQQVVKSISAQTSSLNMKEQARSQDFIALYNKVQEQGVTSNRSITDLSTQMKTLQMNHNTSIKDLGMQIKTLQTNHNASITDLSTELKNVQKNQSIVFVDIESKMRAATIRDNQTFIHLQVLDTIQSIVQNTIHVHMLMEKKTLTDRPFSFKRGIFFSDSAGGKVVQQQIDNNKEQVAMTAHPSSSLTKSGIIKFDDVKFSVGIKNLSAYKSSGKFVCEKEGLYLLSVSVYSFSNRAHFYMYLNGNVISYTWIGYNNNNPSTMANTGTVVHALQLRLNDSVWVYYPDAFYVENGFWSTFTMVKIK